MFFSSYMYMLFNFVLFCFDIICKMLNRKLERVRKILEDLEVNFYLKCLKDVFYRFREYSYIII